MGDRGNSKTILRNTVWYGLENVISFASSLITSIAIARTLGPAKMGYVIYVAWIAQIASQVGSIGIPATTRKYMAEYLGAGHPGIARFIYRRTLLLQALTATLATAISVVWVWYTAPAEFRIAALLLVLSIWPAMVNFVSAQANVAAEELSANVPGSAAGMAAFFVLVMLTIIFHWGVTGVAVAMLGMRALEFVVRFIPTCLRINRAAAGSDQLVAPLELRRRMRSFALQSMMGMALTLVVWDRSEIFLLKYLLTGTVQIAFYSVAFNMAERLLVFPTVFASATGASVFAQYGRDKTRIPALTAASVRYLGLTSIPLHLIASSLAGAALLTLYGHKYAGAAVVCTIAPLLCLPKAFLAPIQTLFEAMEKQQYFNWVTVVASAVDIGMAWVLIPRFGAVGAALSSGSAQILAISTLWALGVRQYRIQLPWAFLGKIAAISSVAAGAAYAVVRSTIPVVGLIVGGCLAVLLFLLLASLLRVFEEQDLARFKVIVDACPSQLSAPVNLTFSWMSRRIAPVVTEELP